MGVLNAAKKMKSWFFICTDKANKKCNWCTVFSLVNDVTLKHGAAGKKVSKLKVEEKTKGAMEEWEKIGEEERPA